MLKDLIRSVAKGELTDLHFLIAQCLIKMCHQLTTAFRLSTNLSVLDWSPGSEKHGDNVDSVIENQIASDNPPEASAC